MPRCRVRVDMGLVGIHRPGKACQVLQLGAKQPQEVD